MRNFNVLLCIGGIFVIQSAWNCRASDWGSTTTVPYGDQLPATAAEATTAPKEYVVRKHDTLWDIARAFFGDPFKWNDLWNKNSWISNPDLIFPGDKLILTGDGTIYTDRSSMPDQGAAATSGAHNSAVNADGYQNTTTTTSSTTYEDTLSFGRPWLTQADHNRIGKDVILFTRKKEFFSPELLIKTASIWTIKDALGVVSPGNGQIEKNDQTASYRQFDEAPVKLFSDARYSVGDQVDVLHPQGLVMFDNATVNVVRRVGRGTITLVNGEEARVKLSTLWDVIVANDRIAPAKQSVRLDIDSVVDPKVDIVGSLFTRIEATEAPYLFQSFIMDAGTLDGVEVGDVFLSFPIIDKVPAARPSIMASVVLTGENWSTLLIIKMYDNKLAEGDKLRLYKRIRFSQRKS